MGIVWKGAARPTRDEGCSTDDAAGPARGLAEARGGKASPLVWIEALERNWALSAALVLGAIVVVTAL